MGDTPLRPSVIPRLKRSARIFVRTLAAVVAILILVLGILVLMVMQPTFRTLRPATPGDAQPRALEAHVRFLCEDVLPRDSRHPENLDRAAEWIGRRLRQSGGRVVEQVYQARGKTYRNVTGSFGPESGPILLIGAHYDAFGELPGADDNASGVAVMLEVGRMLGRSPPPSRVDLVAFTLEEPPFFAQAEMGSAVCARTLRASGATLSGMISLEMLGCYTEVQEWPSGLLSLAYPTRGDFLLIVGRGDDRQLAAHAKKAMRGSSDMRVRTVIAPRMDHLDASDHRSFWDEGYPAIMVTDTAYFRNPRYHAREDTPDTLDYERMAAAANGVYGIASTASRLGRRQD